MHIERKRQSSGDQEGIEQTQATRGLNNKERARLHRERKRFYYQEIESEVQELREKIRLLTEENEKLKEEIKEKSLWVCSDKHGKTWILDEKTNEKEFNKDLERLIQEEKFAYEEIPKMLKNNPEKVRYTLIDQTKETMGSYGTARIKFLK